ncbi:MAG: hypothetical protein ACRDZR_11730 [Acidimicrobiales bacterium]
MAAGRAQSRTVRRYLDSLSSMRPGRGRRRTQAAVEQRLAAIAQELPTSNALTRLHLLQEQENLEHQLARHKERVDLKALEKEFVAVAKDYGDRRGISYGTWRELGVSPAVLTRAGIRRDGR